jgi:DNA helicase-2/ATP-dependent DNA helicase PcrA
MGAGDASVQWLSKLNDAQRAAATAGDDPLLIIAGAGSGKTNTLAHRVAHLIHRGVAPGRILLLTFTRRASAEMLKRVETILAAANRDNASRPSAVASQVWGGTFHAVANRLLRAHGGAVGLGETFTVVDRADAEDLLDTVRSELQLDKGEVRFPKKGTCLSIYSRVVNAQESIDETLKHSFPWCAQYPEPLKRLFKAYVARKQEQDTLDYDDLLLYWFHLMQDDALAAAVRERFDAVLVDEYQDTNVLQARILKGLCPTGRGLTVVGDDAQSIYSFRAATVHNILNFPADYRGAAVLKLEQNYRSVQPILDATNAVIAQSPQRYNKDLFSTRAAKQKPRLVSVIDEGQQSDYVIKRVLEHLEAGVPLRRQAVLFRAAHHSDALEVELARRNIPFVKYGGLKFLEAAHVKDVLSFLRVAENPRDAVSAFRVLKLLDGVGPAHAKAALQALAAARYDVRAWQDHTPPAAAAEQWPAFVKLLADLAPNAMPLPEQVGAVRAFYAPILEKAYDQPEMRRRDVEQLEQISSNFRTRGQMLTDLTLDPPASTQDLAGPPLREEDYLILSTMHSAKGCEWDCVYVLHAADGNIPSDMATETDDQVEEERRLFYVALTRAKDFLDVVFPLRYYHKKWGMGDRHTYAQLTRFLPAGVVEQFERVSLLPSATLVKPQPAGAVAPASDLRKKVAAMWE